MCDVVASAPATFERPRLAGSAALTMMTALGGFAGIVVNLTFMSDICRPEMLPEQGPTRQLVSFLTEFRFLGLSFPGGEVVGRADYRVLRSSILDEFAKSFGFSCAA